MHWYFSVNARVQTTNAQLVQTLFLKWVAAEVPPYTQRLPIGHEVANAAIKG